eukprot:COSAG03_NODE_419_length_8060_cov_243.947996_6_plen_56_part_01
MHAGAAALVGHLAVWTRGQQAVARQRLRRPVATPFAAAQSPNAAAGTAAAAAAAAA